MRTAQPDVQIDWDTWGVPHIYGATISDVAFGFGWAQMRAHGDLLLHLYGQARGRAAEYWGEQYADGDRLVRRMGIPARGMGWLEHQTESFRAVLEGFAAGINAYARNGHPQVSETMRVVLPVYPVDVLRHLQRDLLMFLGGHVLSPGGPSMPAGSNGWAVGPSRTRSGHGMLLINPHLAWGDLFTFFEAHLVAGDLDFYGAALVGNPVLSMGFNDRLGWAHTVNTHNGFDRYLLLPDGEGYLLDGTHQEYDERTEHLLIRDESGQLRDEPLVIRTSRHGPVIDEIEGRPVAARVAGLTACEMPRCFDQWLRMSRARNLDEFEMALGDLQLPMFTVIYADADGHSLSVFNGAVPRRAGGDFQEWLGVQPGDDSKHLWSEIHDYSDLPRVLDPVSGWVQNSNSPPWLTTIPSPIRHEDYPAYMAPPPILCLREQRAIQMLQQAGDLTMADLIRLKHDTRMLLADRVLDDLLRAVTRSGDASLTEPARVLESWDRRCDAESHGAILFVFWIEELSGIRAGWWPPGLFAMGWDEQRPTETPYGVASSESALAALRVAAERTRERFGRLDAPWGELVRLRRVEVDLPGNGSSGDPWGVFRVIDYQDAGDGRREAWHGDTITLIVEFARPLHAVGVLSYGNASQPGSPHATDQLGLVAEQRTRSVWLSRDEVSLHTELSERLTRESIADRV